MSFETFHPIWSDYQNGKTIRPQKAGATFTFDLTPEADKRYRLFTVGTSGQSDLSIVNAAAVKSGTECDQ